MFGTLLKRKSTRSSVSSQNKPAPLSDRHLNLLSRASAREDRWVVLPDDQDNDGIGEALELLLGHGFVERIGQGEGAPFRISAAGLAHIGLPDDEAPIPIPSASDAKQEKTPAIVPQIRPLAEGQKPVSASGRAKAKRAETARQGPKRISQASPPVPSRKAALMALLQRPEGASLKHICETFGWLPHSARAALSGLRKAGHGIQRHVGSEGKDVVYRIVESVTLGHGTSCGDPVLLGSAASGADIS